MNVIKKSEANHGSFNDEQKLSRAYCFLGAVVVLHKGGMYHVVTVHNAPKGREVMQLIPIVGLCLAYISFHCYYFEIIPLVSFL